MIRIAVCDDDEYELRTLTKLLEAYSSERTLDIHISTFLNGFSLLDTIDRGEDFDIAFLDIIMPDENGIDIARSIRKTNEKMEIFF